MRAKKQSLNFSISVPVEEYASLDFLQGMLNRMLQSHYKYGRVRDNYPHNHNAVGTLEKMLARYKRTGNTEFLMDVANMAMIEFMAPRHPDAHFEVADSHKTALAKS